jgi:PilZ domain
MPTNPDRRSHERLKGPFDGSWDGSSGMRTCRVTDLSAGGCFIDAMASPEVGSSVNVSIQLDGRTFVVPATVAYVDRVQGFAVRFTPSEPAEGLAALVNQRLAK